MSSPLETAPPCDRVWDLLVLGGGTAGLVAAKTAARFGASTLLVEAERTGGDCLWTGCVPSKALLAAADVAATARDGARYGVDVGEVRVDLVRVMEHVQAAVRHVEPADSPATVEEVGGHVVAGRGRFTGPGSAEVETPDGRRTTVLFRQAVVATGAAPALPPVPGLADVDPLTSETVWDLRADPGRLVVLGGGAIGCELGQGLARLGIDVSVVEGAERLLPSEDAAASAVLARALAADGVAVRTGASVTEVRRGAGARDGVLLLDDGSEVAFDRLLVAVGRRPRTDDLGLDAAGVEVDERGFVVVDDRLTTTNPRIRAAGDLTGHPQHTHVAGSHGSLAASNAVLGLRRSVDRVVPRVTYTQPEVASVGVGTSGGTDGDRIEVRVVRLDHDHLDRAVTEARTDGFTALALDGRGRIVGATVVAPRAGEMLAELTAAVRRGDRPRDLGATIHPYPAWSDGPWNAALLEVRAGLEKPLPRRATAALVRGRRWWVDRRG